MVDTVKSGKEKMRQYFREQREKQEQHQSNPVQQPATQNPFQPRPITIPQQPAPQPIIVQQPAQQPIYTQPAQQPVIQQPVTQNRPRAEFGFWRALSAFTVMIIMLVTVMWYMQGGLDYAVANWSSVFDYIKSVIQSLVSSV